LAVAALVVWAGVGINARKMPEGDPRVDGQWLIFVDGQGRETWAEPAVATGFMQRALGGSPTMIRGLAGRLLALVTEATKKPGVTLGRQSVVVPDRQGSGSVEIRVDGPWRAISSDASWLTVTTPQGEGDAILTFSWTANTQPAGRIAAISINGARFGVAQVSPSGQATPWHSAGYGTIRTIAGDGQPGDRGDGGPADQARVFNPVGIAVDENANVYFSDFRNQRIRRIRSGDRIISTIAGTGVNGNSGDGGPAVKAQINSPYHLALDGRGNVVFADGDNSRIRRVDLRTGVIETIAGGGESAPEEGMPADRVKLEYPVTGVAIDLAGNLYLSEWYVERLKRVDASGAIRPLPRVDSPNALATDAEGRLYVASHHAHRIVRMEPGTGRLETIAGTGAMGVAVDGVPGPQSPLGGPHGMTVAGDGSVYVADQTGVHRVDGRTGILRRLAGGRSREFSGDGGPALGAGVDAFAIAVDVAGNLYITDYENHRIRFVDLVSGRPQSPRAPSQVKAELGVRAYAETRVKTGHVTWVAPTEAVTGFRIRRFMRAGGACVPDRSFSGSAPARATNYADMSASPEVCGYAVAAESEGGLSSFEPAWIGGGPPPPNSRPRPPVRVNAVMSQGAADGRGPRSVRIGWIDVAMNEEKYLLRRFVVRGKACVEDPGFGVIELLPDSIGYTDENVPAGVCGYQASTSNAAGESIWIGDRDLGPEIVQLL
jgi:sugar lactone lactonase YvrE